MFSFLCSILLRLSCVCSVWNMWLFIYIVSVSVVIVFSVYVSSRVLVFMLVLCRVVLVNIRLRIGFVYGVYSRLVVMLISSEVYVLLCLVVLVVLVCVFRWVFMCWNGVSRWLVSCGYSSVIVNSVISSRVI